MELTLVAKDYGPLSPIAMGDIKADGFDLKVDRDTHGAINRTLRDPAVLLGESSISRQLARTAAGDDTWVALPVFLMRGFRHRCFIVRKDSGYTGFHDLVGKRIGTDNWMASGSTWSRAAMREQGVEPSSMEWTCGPTEGKDSGRSQANLPEYAHMIAERKTLVELMNMGELDAMMIPFLPSGFYEESSPFMRLFPDFKSVEQAYFERTGVWPGIHIAVMRRSLFREHPELAPRIVDAIERSRKKWVSERLFNNESPWMQDEFENDQKLLGANWGAHGYENNKDMVDVFCAESYEQGVIAKRFAPEDVFADYLAVSNDGE